MSTITITLVHDAAVAETLREALADAGIAVEIRRIGGSPYFGSMTPEEFEVRVPEDQVDGARHILADLEESLTGAASAAVDDGAEAVASEPTSKREQPRKASWAVAIGMLLPIGGTACFYARGGAVGFVLLGITLGALGLAPRSPQYAGYVFAIGKLLDLILAPMFVSRYNQALARRQEEEAHAAHA